MKKKYRNITIDEVLYTWASGHNNCDGDGSNLLTIWKNKKPFHQQLFKYDIEITPSQVKDVINNLKNNEQAAT
jgi:hypothetical protein